MKLLAVLGVLAALCTGQVLAAVAALPARRSEPPPAYCGAVVTFNFNGETDQCLLSFSSYNISDVSTTAFKGLTPHSPPGIAAHVPLSSSTAKASMQVPEGSDHTFALQSFYIVGAGNLGTEATFTGYTVSSSSTPALSRVYTLGGSGGGMQFVNAGVWGGWTGLVRVEVLVDVDGVEKMHALDDLSVRIEC